MLPSPYPASHIRHYRRRNRVDGPDIGSGGRRVNSGETEEHEDELPEYQKDRLPVYSIELSPISSDPTREANVTEATAENGDMSVADYEQRVTRGTPPSYILPRRTSTGICGTRYR